MHSHRYEISKSDTLNAIVAPLVVLLGIVAAAHFLRMTNFLGPINAPEYVEQIVIREKERAANEPVNPDVLFVGDSSCLMDFSARELEQLLPGASFYNLGSLSTLGLAKFGEYTAAFLAKHTNVQTVVLLISPEMVRSGSAELSAFKPPQQSAVMKELAALRDERKRIKAALEKAEAREQLLPTALALPFIRTHLVARVFEAPYEGGLGFAYGFPSGVREFMIAHNGSAVDPSGENVNFGHAGDAEAPTGFAGKRFRAQCETFRTAVSTNVKLLVGLTPEPESVCGSNRVEQVRRTLLTLKEFLRADGVLTNLRVTLPNHYFSTTTHLNPQGARQFTHALAATLQRRTEFAFARNSRRAAPTAQGSAPGSIAGKSDERNAGAVDGKNSLDRRN